MTLVAAFKRNDVPVIIGDFLVTDELQNVPHDFTPTSPGLPELPGKKERRRHGVRLKVSIVNDKLAVAFTGHIAAGEQLVRGLRKQFSTVGTSAEMLFEFLDDTCGWPSMKYRQGVERLYDAHLVGWIADTEPRCFQYSLQPGKTVKWVNEAVNGSGRHHFGRIRRNQNTFGEGQDKKEAVPGHALRLCSQVLMTEIRGRSTFASNYGYGFEVAIWQDGKFRHVTPTAALYYRVDLGLTRCNVSPILVRTFERDGDYAVLQTIPFDRHIGPDGKDSQGTYCQVITSLEIDPQTRPDPPELHDVHPVVGCASIEYEYKNQRTTKTGHFHGSANGSDFTIKVTPATNREPNSFSAQYLKFNELILELKKKVVDR
jgi:hypothetical protein